MSGIPKTNKTDINLEHQTFMGSNTDSTIMILVITRAAVWGLNRIFFALCAPQGKY